MAALGLLSFVAWLKTSVRVHSTKDLSAESEPFRLLFWNADHYGAGFFEPVEQLAEFEADIVLLAESNASHGPQKQAFARYFPEYQYMFTRMRDFTIALGPGYILKNTRYPHLKNLRQGYDRKNWAYVIVLDIETKDGSPLRVIAFDQASDMESDRIFHLLLLNELLEQESQDGVPIVVAGDFNVPADTAALEVLREAGWKRAFESSGRGLGETWPTPLPFLALDQCWTREGITVAATRHADISWKFAHQALIIDAAINPTAP